MLILPLIFIIPACGQKTSERERDEEERAIGMHTRIRANVIVSSSTVLMNQRSDGHFPTHETFV